MKVFVRQFFGPSFGDNVISLDIENISIEDLIMLLVEKIQPLYKVIQNNPAVINFYTMENKRITEPGRLCSEYGISYESTIILAPKMGDVVLPCIAYMKRILDGPQ